MLGNLFRLRSTLSASARANENDIQNAKRVFGSLGYLASQTRRLSNQPDNTLFDGIRLFQSDHGLATDGVMKPSGETERMVSKVLEKGRSSVEKSTSSLVATPEPDQRPSLLDKFPSRTPDTISHDRKRAGDTTQSIKKLLELIAKKAQDNEIIAEGARTVNAALKTSEHTDLAKFHATAVKEFGDDALAEVEEFRKQLLAANKPVHDSWLRAFTEELPGDTQRMMLANTQGEDDMKGGEEDGSVISLPPIPDTKKDWFKGKEHEWEEFHTATSNLPDITKYEHVAYMHIFGQEGGHKKNEESTASAGLLQGTADIYLGEGELKSIPKGTPTESLPANAKAIIYRNILDDEFPKIGGHKVLAKIGDNLGATAVADGLIRLGHSRATDAIQKAMNRIDPKSTNNDKTFGSGTLKKFRELVASPQHRNDFLNAIVDEYITKEPDETNRFDALRP